MVKYSGGIEGLKRKRWLLKGLAGTQVLTVFDVVIAQIGLLEHEAKKVSFSLFTTVVEVDDQKAYYSSSQKLTIRNTSDDIVSGKLLGAQLTDICGSEAAKWNDNFATIIHLFVYLST